MDLDFFFIRSIWIWIWIYYFYLGSDMDFEKSDPNPIQIRSDAISINNCSNDNYLN